MTVFRPNETRQATPLLLVVIGLCACAAAERFGYRDLVTIAVATNAAGLALLTQHRIPAARVEANAAGVSGEKKAKESV